MQVHRANLLHYLNDALKASLRRDTIHGDTFVSIDTSAIRATIEAVRNGEILEYFDES